MLANKRGTRQYRLTAHVITFIVASCITARNVRIRLLEKFRSYQHPTGVFNVRHHTAADEMIDSKAH